MLRSSVLRSYDSESLDDLLIGLQERGCSYMYEDTEKADPSVPDEEEPDDEDLTNEEKFLRDWGRRPVHANVVGSLAYEYICPANTGLLIDQTAYNPETGLCSAPESACSECAKRFWKSKYKKPEKKEV